MAKKDVSENEETPVDEPVTADAAEEPVADATVADDAAPADEVAEEPEAAEPEVVAEVDAGADVETEPEVVAEDEPADAPEPVAVVEPVAEAEPTEAAEAVAEAEPVTETESDAPAAEASSAPAEVVAPPQSGPKPKKKRLPRALRPARTKPTRDKPATRKSIVRLDKPDHDRGRRQERQGTVVSDAMDKTIVVRVEVLKAHPKYKKVVRRSVKFHAHDERSEAKVGDVVRIVETRPLSKTKRWRLAEVVEAAK